MEPVTDVRELGDDGVQLCLVAGAERDLCSVASEDRNDRRSDPPARAGDDGPMAVEGEVGHGAAKTAGRHNSRRGSRAPSTERTMLSWANVATSCPSSRN